jgi:membrane-associated phospholipid phosphatase
MSLAVLPDLPPDPPAALAEQRPGGSFALYKWALAFLVGSVGLALYQVLGRTELHRSTTLLDTAFDRAIPLLPWSVWFYEPFYVAIFVVATVGLRTRRMFHRALACVVANASLGAVGHALVRAQYPRPALPPPLADLSLAFLAFVYRIDPPGNVFPSLHVAHAFSLALVLRLDRPRLGTAALVMASLLALSTLTTKQHFIADVLAGLVMAAVARVAVGWSLRRPQRG